MAKFIRISHMGTIFKWTVNEHNPADPGPFDQQIDASYSASLFSDIMNDFSITPLSGTPVNIGHFANNQFSLVLEDFGQHLNQAEKLLLQSETGWINNKVMMLLNNGKFYNPDNGRYFTVTGTISDPYFNLYTAGDTLIESFQFSEFNIYWLNFYSFTDFNAFATAETWNAAQQYCVHLGMGNNYYGPDQSIYIPYQKKKDVTYASFFKMLWILLGGEDPSEDVDDDPYSGDDSPYDPADTGGGDGDGDNPYDPGDPNPFPDDPPFSIADSGLMSVYIPSNVQLNLLGAYLWSNNFFSSLVKDMYADAMDVILSLGVLPFNIPAAGSRNIMVGDRDSGVGSNYPSEKYHTLDCGSIHLGTTIGAYIDYAPYTKGDIYIPFVGMVPLDIDAFMGHDIGLKYKVEICTGAAVAFLMRDSDVWQTFACNLLTPIPLSGGNYSQMWQTVVSATAALAGAGAAGAAGMGAAATAGEAAEGAQAVSGVSGNAAKASSGIMSAAATKPSIQKSNNISVLAGILVNKKPFILLHRPNLMLPTDQNKLQGYPSYIKETLSNINGYSRVSSINLSVPGATAREINLIDSILKTGFIVGSGTNISGSGIILGRNTSPTHQINKQVTHVATLTGTFRDSVDILSPVVRIEYSNPVGFDYVYISDFGRYYYVEDITIVRTGILDLHLSIDVLESHKAAILANTAILDKQENKYNLYLNDDSIKMRQDPLVTCKVFPNGMFENDAYEYVLCVAGN